MNFDNPRTKAQNTLTTSIRVSGFTQILETLLARFWNMFGTGNTILGVARVGS